MGAADLTYTMFLIQTRVPLAGILLTACLSPAWPPPQEHRSTAAQTTSPPAASEAQCPPSLISQWSWLMLPSPCMRSLPVATGGAGRPLPHGSGGVWAAPSPGVSHCCVSCGSAVGVVVSRGCGRRCEQRLRSTLSSFYISISPISVK